MQRKKILSTKKLFQIIINLHYRKIVKNIMKNTNNCCPSDDETLGCGGLIHNLRSKNNKVKVVVLGEGSSCRYKKKNSENIKKLIL